MEGLDTFKSQTLEIVAGDRMRAAFDLSAEDAKLRDQYGRHRYGQSALLARRLVEAGTRCVNINTGNWDHHNDIAKGLEEHLPPLDHAIAMLVKDLSARGLLNDVIIYCAGEFGRTPRMNGHAGAITGRTASACCWRVATSKAVASSARVRSRAAAFRSDSSHRKTCWPLFITRSAFRSTRTTRMPAVAPSASSAAVARFRNCYEERRKTFDNLSGSMLSTGILLAIAIFPVLVQADDWPQ